MKTINDLLATYATEVMLAKLKIEEAGMVPKVIYPVDLTPPVKIKVVVDIEATIRLQTSTIYEIPELVI